MDKNAKILFIVEGAKTDKRLMQEILAIYNITNDHEVYSYNTNLHHLYRVLSQYDEWNDIDLLNALKEHERDKDRKEILSGNYSDILLIFDMDPQDQDFSSHAIFKMLEVFNESTDMGKLYINYPMVESFYHMKSIPDEDYDTYYATMDELRAKTYKERVRKENRNHSYSKFAREKYECDIVIKQNISKGFMLTGEERENIAQLPDPEKILNKQIKLLEDEKVSVLCTAVYFIVEYNPSLVFDEE